MIDHEFHRISPPFSNLHVGLLFPISNLHVGFPFSNLHIGIVSSGIDYQEVCISRHVRGQVQEEGGGLAEGCAEEFVEGEE